MHPPRVSFQNLRADADRNPRMSETGGWTRAYQAVGLVTALPLSTIVGGVVGAWIDRALDSGWLFTASLGLLGFAAGVFQLFRGLRKLSDDQPDDHPP